MKGISAGSEVCSGQRRLCLCSLFFCCSPHNSVGFFIPSLNLVLFLFPPFPSVFLSVTAFVSHSFSVSDFVLFSLFLCIFKFLFELCLHQMVCFKWCFHSNKFIELPVQCTAAIGLCTVSKEQTLFLLWKL